MKRKYRLVLFDSDGTLANTLPWAEQAFGGIADRHGFKKVAPEDRLRFREMGTRELMRELEMPVWKIPVVMREMRSLMARHLDELALFEGIPDMLRRLDEAGCVLAVVSSNSLGNVQHILGPDNVRRIRHFSCGVSIFGKASKLKSVLRAAAVPAAESIYIGDEVRDGEAARQAGLDFGAVTWGQHSPKALKAVGPAVMFSSVEEIAARLLG